MASRLHRRRVMRQFLIGVLLALAVALPVMLVAPPVMPADEDCTLIEDFGRAKVGEFPAGWKPRKDAGKSIYAVQEEGGKHFLCARGRGGRASSPGAPTSGSRTATTACSPSTCSCRTRASPGRRP